MHKVEKLDLLNLWQNVFSGSSAIHLEIIKEISLQGEVLGGCFGITILSVSNCT